MRTVAILCAAKKTAYRDIPDLEIYDEIRDARTFPGGMPVVAHPPCRRWTTFGMNMLKAAEKHGNRIPTKEEIDQERELGLFCAQQVIENGGILEQPAKSRLFEAAGIPLPGSSQSPNSFSLHVWQRWWGYPIKKGTWLYFRGISQFNIEIPFCLHQSQSDAKVYEAMSGSDSRREWGAVVRHSSTERSRTVPALAQWLVDLARTSSVETPIDKPILST